MKLYEVPLGSNIKVVGSCDTPPFAHSVSTDEELYFYHTDGAYSLCKNHKGDMVHPAAWTEVVILPNK